MPKYLWKCLNKTFWLWQGSEFILSLYMFDRILKMPRVLSQPAFWIWHGCICKGYAEFRIFLIMAAYASIMPDMSQYALKSFNILEHGWILLNVHEYAWKCLNKLFWYVRVLNMLRYNYNNIITVTNVFILEILFARFVHTDALPPFYFYFLIRVRTQ